MRAISSQAPQECGEGSTTRVYYLDQIMKPHERTAVRVCTKCGEEPQSGTSSWCKTCKAAYMRQLYHSDPARRENLNAKSRAYYAENRGEILEQKSEYGKKVSKRDAARRRERYRDDPEFREKTNLRTTEYYYDNPHVFRARDAKRRADQLNATPAWADMGAIKAIYRQAREMTDSLGEPYEVDHVVPLKGRTVCGLHVPQNLQIIPQTDNRKKFNRLPEDIV